MANPRVRTIRACIADEAIAKVMQFFDGTLSQTLHEILQNARRSGATNVTIAHDDGKNRITVRDDGRGISDPRALLAFGRSDWPEELRQESPAGMGVFSLARRSPRIRSRIADGRAWALQLSQDHFIGRAPAVVENDDDWTAAHGTEVAFSTLPTDNAWIPSVIAEAVRHYPIPATFNGRKPEQVDFLKDAIRVETWRGMRIGVFSSTSTTWAHQLPRARGAVPGPPAGPRAPRCRRRRPEGLVDDGRRRRLPGPRAHPPDADRDRAHPVHR